MNQVWLFYCVLNLIADSVCMAFHVVGSLYFQEPLPHNMVFCGTFGGFILIAIMRGVRILIGLRTRLYPTLVIDFFGIILHFLCAILSLHYAENDFHLIFMAPQQELDHHYFRYCKQQSIASIFAGALYLLQFALVLDIIQKSPPLEDEKPIKKITEIPEYNEAYRQMSIEEHDELARTQANVYLFGRQLDHWFRVKSKWFRQLAGGQELINNSELLPMWKSYSSLPISHAGDDDENDIKSRKSSVLSSRSKKTKFAVINEANSVGDSSDSVSSLSELSGRR